MNLDQLEQLPKVNVLNLANEVVTALKEHVIIFHGWYV